MSTGKQEYLAHWKKIEDKLQIADIILVRDKKARLSKYIRKATKSYWNHVALVFKVPDRKILFNNTLIIEAYNNGIEIHRIQKYINKHHRYDIGVKRVPGLTEEEKNKILAFMFNNLDVPYDYTRLIGLLLKHYFGRIIEERQDKFISQEKFVCSSFTQRAFYNALSKEKKTSVIFSSETKNEKDLEYTTPGCIAKSNKCQWISNHHD